MQLVHHHPFVVSPGRLLLANEDPQYRSRLISNAQGAYVQSTAIALARHARSESFCSFSPLTDQPSQLKHWPLHKAMCKTLIKQQNLLETHSLHQPGGIASAATMAAFTRAGQAEVDVAAYASLKLTGPNPIHTTHAFYIFLRPVPYEEDASVAFEVVAALVMPHLEIEKLVNYPGAPVTIGAKSLPISISDQLSQDGLNNFMGLRDGIPGFRTATVWQAHMVDGTYVPFSLLFRKSPG